MELMQEVKKTTVPVGYRKTEIGILPVEWEVKSISEISNPVRGGSPRPAGDPKYFNGNYIPWLTVASLTNIPVSQIYVKKTKSYLTEAGSLQSRILEIGTVIIANSGATLGVVKILGIKCCANDGIAALFDVSIEVNKPFLTHFLNTKTKFLREVVATGNGQPNLNTDLISNILIPVPPLKEQIAIAAALSDTDALITSITKQIEKKRQIKEGAMQQLLMSPEQGGVRLKGFSGDWEIERLGECLLQNPDYGINASSVKLNDNLPTYLRITDINEDGNFSKKSMASVDSPYSGNYVLCESEIVFARTGASTGKSYLYNSADGILVFAGFLIRCKIDTQKLNPYFLKIFSETKKYWDWVKVMSMRSGQPGINSKELSGLEIPLPPLPEQIAISDIFSDMDIEIQELEAKRKKYELIKVGMMRDLLTGKVRLI